MDVTLMEKDSSYPQERKKYWEVLCGIHSKENKKKTVNINTKHPKTHLDFGEHS